MEKKQDIIGAIGMALGILIIGVSVIVHIFFKLNNIDASFSMATIPLGLMVGIVSACMTSPKP